MTSDARPLPHWLTISTGPAPAVVDGRACRTRAAFFEEVARALRFPAHFGRNWDALTDCLRDVTARDGIVALVVEHAEDLLAADPPGRFATLLEILAESAEDGLAVTLCATPGHDVPLRDRVTAALP
ncbi:barstar family protein [Planomonospora corallina]|uniref:Barstar family protein n=1 Tax=Planomonospora corallina TaxID=1806052 RepID=A0ABV8IIQ6_9ACTN